MLIDWFTVGAQALNFVILVWLMRRFLYQPILRAIDAREQQVAAQLAAAAATEATAQQARDEFQRKNDELDDQRATLVGRATDEANLERGRLLDEARAAAEALTTKRRDALRGEADALSQAIGRHARDEVFAIARMALLDLAGASLEERMCDAFTNRVRELDGVAKASLGAALGAAAAPALVRSAFELSTPQRAAIQRALDEVFVAQVHLRFETSSALIGGIELVAKGQKVAWSVDGYLDALAESVEALADERRQPAGEPGAGDAAAGEVNEHAA